jgi:ATP-dependent Clp protease ATP-binding subunit ClpB
MDFQKLTIRSQEAVAAAQDIARRRGNPEIAPDHLLLALLDQELFTDWQQLRPEAEQHVEALPSVQGGAQQPNASAAFARVLDRADEERARLEDDYISTEHLFLALEPAPRDEILKWIKAIRGNRRITSQDPEGTTGAPKFGRDLTEPRGEARPVIGRTRRSGRDQILAARRTTRWDRDPSGQDRDRQKGSRSVVAGDVLAQRDRKVWARHGALSPARVPRRIRGSSSRRCSPRSRR